MLSVTFGDNVLSLTVTRPYCLLPLRSLWRGSELECAEKMFRLKLPTELESLRELDAFRKEAREPVLPGDPKQLILEA